MLAELLTITWVTGKPPIKPDKILPTPWAHNSLLAGVTRFLGSRRSVASRHNKVSRLATRAIVAAVIHTSRRPNASIFGKTIKSFKLPADLSKFEKQENLSSMDLEVKVTESVCDGTYLKKWESVEPNVITEYHDRDCSEVFQTLIPTVLAWDSYREALNKLSSSYFEEILINGKEMYEISGFPGENLFDTLVVRFDFVSLFPLFSRISTRKNIESNGDTIKILNEIEEEIIYSEEEFNIKNVEFSFSSRVNAKNVRIIE